MDLFADRPEHLAVKPEHLAGLPQPGAAGLQALRLASLRPLRFPVFAERSDSAERARASSIERRRQRSGLLHQVGQGRRSPGICCRTSSRIRGTASSAGPRIFGRRTTTCPCRTACCGSTKDKPSTGARCWLRARDCARRQQALDQFAITAAHYEVQNGRQWRPLQDTTNDEIINPRRPHVLARLAALRGLLRRRPR